MLQEVVEEGQEEGAEEIGLYQTRPQTRMGPLRTPPAINATIKALLESDTNDQNPLGIEEVCTAHNSRVR